MSKLDQGIPFTKRPVALQFDYKTKREKQVYRATGSPKISKLEGTDNAEAMMLLIHRWEDEDGNIHALRVGTAIERIEEDIPDWINGHELVIGYGDMTSESCYREYMGLKTDPETAYHAINSKGKNVVIQEEGWAPVGTQPTHLLIHVISSCGKAFYGGVGNTVWIDNVEVVM